jgi:NNP family nitrate/nitrite transporter-like MFS transporter
VASDKLNVLEFSNPSIRTLHLTWVAFFITFMVWFSHAPLMPFIKEAFDLDMQQVKALLILNVALTIPSRIVIGMLVDRFGPRLVYSGLLLISAFFCWGFAFANSYEQLALLRFLGGFVGAGFVIGIRLVSEWFPARQVGMAEGIYGGWGNFGACPNPPQVRSKRCFRSSTAEVRIDVSRTSTCAFTTAVCRTC